MIIGQPLPTEHPPYYQSYLNLVKDDDVIKTLKDQIIDIQAVIATIPEEKEGFSYAEGKWTIKEVIGHIIDTERILAYRAMRFARKDKTILPGFDENTFVANANFNKRTLYELAHEFAIVREANITMFKTFDKEQLIEKGNANGQEVSVRSIIYMIAGHAAHHVNVIRTKYLMD